MAHENISTCYTYPGSYVPLLTPEQIDEELCRIHIGDLQLPPVNIEELGDAFKIEIAVPGLKREDFLIHIDSHTLYIRVLNTDLQKKANINFKQHEFNFECFEKRIRLPQNADAGFLSAEYKTGLLVVTIPKSSRPVENPHLQIVVY